MGDINLAFGISTLIKKAQGRIIVIGALLTEQ